jgi:hypothetical protein
MDILPRLVIFFFNVVDIIQLFCVNNLLKLLICFGQSLGIAHYQTLERIGDIAENSNQESLDCGT